MIAQTLALLLAATALSGESRANAAAREAADEAARAAAMEAAQQEMSLRMGVPYSPPVANAAAAMRQATEAAVAVARGGDPAPHVDAMEEMDSRLEKICTAARRAMLAQDEETFASDDTFVDLVDAIIAVCPLADPRE